jgi:DNA invertase Pin-like site-specific DNA recombinase
VKSWADLGVSSYRGRNAKSGNFGEFLEAARNGDLPMDSVLLVENLDRVSRQTPRKALSQFLEVLNLGIGGIVTLTDNELFTAKTVDEEASGMKLFASLMVMIRANNESRLKGERVAAAWSRKRVAAREKSLPMTDRIPGWLLSVRDATGRRTVSEDTTKADIVRRIFAETDQGFGRRAIAKGLNRDGKKSFLSESGWQPSSVAKIIRARTTVGEYQPHRRDENGRRIPDGEPIKGYYPTVIDEALWVRAGAAVTVRRTNSAGRPNAEVANLVRGLARCSCGARMIFLNKGAPPKGGCYHTCSAAARDDGCDNKRLWPARDVERYLMHQIDPASIAAAFEPATKRTAPSPRAYDLQIAELMALKDAAIDAAMRHSGKPLAEDFENRAEAFGEQIGEKRKLRDEAAAAERSRPHLPTTQSAIGTVAALAAKLVGSTPEDKRALRTSMVQQLRTAFSEITFRTHAIVGLIELPEKPKSLKRASGLPRPIDVRTTDAGERYFLRHVFFSDDPDELAGLGGGKGIVRPSFV